jgi:drug/metabolite transporter (DMT)-like permease
VGDASAGLGAKTLAVSAVVILSNVFGNFCLGWGIKHAPALSPSPLSYLRVMANPWVALGILLLICWLLSRMTLLSWADLSFVLPVTSLGYVLTAGMGQFFLGEHISWQRWMGTLLIVAGTALVGSTAPRTTS